MDNGVKRGRRKALVSAWDRLRDGAAVAAVLLGAGCGPAVVQQQTATPIQPDIARSGTILQGDRMAQDGQALIWMRERVRNGEVVVTATANISSSQNYRFDWLIYEDMSSSAGPFLLNPQYREQPGARFIGVVVRGATLSDGTSGDFVVRTRRESAGASSAPEYVPRVERDGTIRRENVLYRLQAGTLMPVEDSLFSASREEVSIITDTPQVTVVEFGAVTPVAVIDDRLPISRSESISAAVVSASMNIERAVRATQDGGTETIVTFTGRDTMIMQRNEGSMLLPEYEARHGRLELTYNWLMFQDVQPHTGMLLLNPRYRDESQPRYVGMLLQGVTTTDGASGDFVVRVRRVERPSADFQWAPIMESDGRVRPENVLLRMRAGTNEPENDELLRRNVESIAFQRGGNMVSVVEYGPTTPVVFVSVPGKMCSQGTPVSATTGGISPRY